VLRRNERIQKTHPALALHCLDLSTSTSNVRVSVKRLPQMIQAVVAGFCPDVEQDADVGVQHAAKGIEKPTMGIEFLCVLFLETENHLHWHNTLLCTLKFERLVEGDLCRVLVNVGLDFPSINQVLCNASLVTTHCGESIENSGVDLLTAV